MRGLAAALVVVWLVAVVTVALVDSAPAGALTGGLLLVVGLVSVQAAQLVARRRSEDSLDRQVTAGVTMAVAQMLLAAGLFAGVMFFSAHDAVLIVLVSLFAGLLGLLTARMVTRRLVADVRAVRDGLVEVGTGRRDTRIGTSGSAEMAELADAANAMTERLAAEERARRNLIAAISHDLRTPLTSLRLIADALGDEILEPDERRRYVERLRRHVAALNGLIEDLFELSRLEAGETTWATERVQLAMLVGDTVDAMHAQARAERVRIECHVPEALRPVRANPEKLQRVLFNLLQNAIRHTPARGAVRVLAEPADGHVEVEIADSGPGIPDADRAHVFEAFFQAGDRAARGRGGAGLGLAISRAIVEAHDGRIWLEDGEGGARVRFSLPVAAD
jgi:signal transduction histidine kinase